MTDIFRFTRTLAGRMGVGQLGRSAVLSTLGLGARAIIQACYLLVLSHWMGAQGYGLFAGSVAAAILIAPLSGWGITFVLTRRVARNPSESRAVWATSVLQIFVSGAVLVGLMLLGAKFLLTDRVSAASMLLLGVAELIALPLAQAATSLCLALGRSMAAATSMCLVPVFRLLAVLSGLLTGMEGTPTHVVCLHFIGSIVGALIAYFWIAKLEGAPCWSRRSPLRSTLRAGSSYASGALTSTGYLEVDKILLLQVLGATAAGTYTAAFRVMSVFALPVAALIGAALPRLFVEHGTSAGARTLKLVTLLGLGYAVLATTVAVVVSPWMPMVFGDSFQASSRYLVLLAPWTVLYALHQAGATGLTAFNRQMSRVSVESIGFALVVALNLALYPCVGAAGAAWSLLSAELFMTCACWWLLRKATRPFI